MRRRRGGELARLGRRRRIVELRVRWRKGPTFEPDWEIDGGYFIEIEGRPTIRTKLEILPPPDFRATTFDDFMVLGMILTAMPAINAIPDVVAAAARHRDLHRHPPPAPAGPGVAGRLALTGTALIGARVTRRPRAPATARAQR